MNFPIFCREGFNFILKVGVFMTLCAEGCGEIKCIFKSCRQHLTSSLKEKRCVGVKLLADVLHRLPQDLLTEKEGNSFWLCSLKCRKLTVLMRYRFFVISVVLYTIGRKNWMRAVGHPLGIIRHLIYQGQPP